MVIESANVSTAVNTGKAEQEPKAQLYTEANQENEGKSEAGETSSIGPAVVNNVSATTLETSRAVSAPEQSAAQNRLNDIVEAEKKGQNQPTNEELISTGNQTLLQSPLDTKA